MDAVSVAVLGLVSLLEEHRRLLRELGRERWRQLANPKSDDVRGLGPFDALGKLLFSQVTIPIPAVERAFVSAGDS